MKERAKPRSIAKRSSSMGAMVEEWLAETDPDGYAILLAELRAEMRPVDTYEHALVKRLAGVAWRKRACFDVENSILRKGMQAAPGGEKAPDALLYAYQRDLEGPNLLSKLSTYEDGLTREFSRCMRALERSRAMRRHRSNAAAAALAKLEPCTSVVQ